MLPATGGSHSIIRATSRNASAWRCPAHRRRVPSALGRLSERQKQAGRHQQQKQGHDSEEVARTQPGPTPIPVHQPAGQGAAAAAETQKMAMRKPTDASPPNRACTDKRPDRGEDACTGPQEGLRDSKKGGAPADQPVTIGDGKTPSGSGTDRYLISRSFSRTAYTTASIRECSWSFSRMFRM